jgi:flagellar hook protein FlgE
MANSIAYTGIQVSQKMLSTISNNLSNVQSTAFQQKNLFSQALLNNNSEGFGVSVAGQRRSLAQGILNDTSRSLDVAMNGQGYFVFEDGNSVHSYSRNGILQISSDLHLKNNTGESVLGFPNMLTSQIGNGGTLQPLLLKNSLNPGDTLQINASGEIAITHSDGTSSLVGTMAIAKFANEQGLYEKGNARFHKTPSSGEPVIINGKTTTSTVQQGFLERSNVDLTQQLSNLIRLQAGHNAQSKSLSGYDEIVEKTLQLL